MEYSSAFVCLMGMGTVFFGLICIVALCYAMSAVCRRTERRKTVPAAPAVPARPSPSPRGLPSGQPVDALTTDLQRRALRSYRGASPRTTMSVGLFTGVFKI